MQVVCSESTLMEKFLKAWIMNGMQVVCRSCLQASSRTTSGFKSGKQVYKQAAKQDVGVSLLFTKNLTISSASSESPLSAAVSMASCHKLSFFDSSIDRFHRLDYQVLLMDQVLKEKLLMKVLRTAILFLYLCSSAPMVNTVSVHIYNVMMNIAFVLLIIIYLMAKIMVIMYLLTNITVIMYLITNMTNITVIM